MAKTIGTLAYQIVADTKGFTEGVTMTRKETALLKEVLDQTRTPAQKTADAIAGLDALFKKGALSEAQFAKATASVRDEFASLSSVSPEATNVFGGFNAEISAAIPGLGKLGASLSGGPLMVALVAAKTATDAVAAGFRLIGDAAAYATAQIAHQYDVLSDTINAAENLGIAASSFQVISGAAHLADIEASSLKSSMESMLTAISKGDTAKFGHAFEMLGLDFRELKAMQPDQALREILVALDGIGNQADKVRVAKQIFGDADILRLHADTLDEIKGILEDTGAILDDPAELEALAAREEAWKKLLVTIDAIWQNVATELAPALAELATVAAEFMLELGKSEGLKDSLKVIADVMMGIALSIRNVADEAATAFSFLAKMIELVAYIDPIASTVVNATKATVAASKPFQELGAAQREGKALDREREKAVKDRAVKSSVSNEDQAIVDDWDEIMAAIDNWKRGDAIELDRTFKSMYDNTLKEIGEQQKAEADIRKRGEAALKSGMTDKEKLLADLEELQKLNFQGGLTDEEFLELKDRRVKEFDDKQGKQQKDYRLSAMEKGSQEAIAFLENARRGGISEKEVAKESRDLLALIENHLRATATMPLTVVESL